MSNILEGLTSGVFTAIKDFITSFAYGQINGIINLVGGVLPDFTPLLPYLENLFNMVLNYCLYILDASFIESPIFTYLIISLIFKISAPALAYIIKLIVKWWHALAP